MKTLRVSHISKHDKEKYSEFSYNYTGLFAGPFTKKATDSFLG